MANKDEYIIHTKLKDIPRSFAAI